jgi:phage virion morphogenesis protein
MPRYGAFVKVSAGKAIRGMTDYAKRLNNPQPALKRVGRYVTELSKQAFREGADPTTNHPWAPLSPATIARRRGERAQILVDTGRLKKSVHSIITGKRSVAIGTNVKYGAVHQFGGGIVTSGRSGGSLFGVPARPFLGIDRRGENQIENIVARYIATGAA